MKWQGQRVLVTGAGGFIGSHLAERLVELGASTRAFVRYTSSASWGWLDQSRLKDEIEVVAGDLRDPDILRKAMRGIERVFHLAALIGIPYSYETPLAYVRTNIEGTVNVLQAAQDAGVRLVVHTSTSEVYGTARHVPINEQHPLQAQSPYAASKIGAEKMVEAFGRTYGVPVVILRPFNTFGPRQSARAIVPTIISQCLTDRGVRLGNTRPTRDLNYVDDMVRGFILAAETPTVVGQIINVGSGREVSIEQVVRLVGERVGRVPEIVRDEVRVRPPESEVERLVADNTRARTLLGWEPSISLEDGVQRTIDWMREHRDAYRAGVYVL